MPRELLYSKIMEHNMQQNILLVQLHIRHNGNYLVAQGVILLPLQRGPGVLYQPRVVPTPGRGSVCPRPGVELCALGLRAECCHKQMTMYLSLFPAKPGFLWIWPEKCWGTEELEHFNPQFLSSIESQVPSVMAQRWFPRCNTQPIFLTTPGGEGNSSENQAQVPQNRHTQRLFVAWHLSGILHFPHLSSRPKPLESFQNVFARLFIFNNVCFS